MYQLVENKNYHIYFIDGTVTILTNTSGVNFTKESKKDERAAKKFIKVFNKFCSKDAIVKTVNNEQFVLVYTSYPKKLSEIIFNPEDTALDNKDTYEIYLKSVFQISDQNKIKELVNKYIGE